MRAPKLPEPNHLTLSASHPNSFGSRPAFNANAEEWEEYTNTPLGQLRQTLTLRYLAPIGIVAVFLHAIGLL